MAIRYYLRDASGTVVEVAGRIRALTADTSVNAEEGSVGMFRVDIDDPAGTYRVGGHRLLYVVETDADPMDQIIAFGYTAERVISRGDLIEGMGTGGRVISVDVADLNTILSRRVMTGADAKRPAETDVERVRWLVMTNEAALVIDSRYLDGSSPKPMEAVDYNGQMLMDVIQDCAEASGKNYGLTWFQTGADPHTQTAVSFFYLFPGDPIWSSTARLTNVAADVDDTTTFVVASAELTQSPMRVYSGIYGTGDGASAYRQSLATATAFARRDTIMSFPNVKSAAKLTTRIDRMLDDLASEEYRVSITFFMRPGDVNRVRPGMRVRVKFSHLPELGSGYVWLRMLTRQVTQGEDETGFAFYKIAGMFSAEVPAPELVQYYTSTGDAGTGGGAFTAILPQVPAAGNLLVACFTSRAAEPADQTGWTTIALVNVGGAVNPGQSKMMYRQAGAGESATLVFNAGVASRITILELRNVDVLDVFGTTAPAINLSPSVSSAALTLSSNRVLIGMVTVTGTGVDGGNTLPLYSIDAPLTQIDYGAMTAGEGPTHAVGYRILNPASGSYDMDVSLTVGGFTDQGNVATIIAAFR